MGASAGIRAEYLRNTSRALPLDQPPQPHEVTYSIHDHHIISFEAT
jgi:hypothetical protein